MNAFDKQIEYLNAEKPVQIREKTERYPPILKLVQLGFNTIGHLFPRSSAKMAYRLFATPYKRAKHKVSDEILEKAYLFEVLYGKQRLKAYSWGRGDRNVLLVHGWQSRGTALRSFVPSLVEKGYRVIAFDGPAHGDSSGKQTNLPHFAGAVRAVINHLGKVNSIITHSFGGASTVFAMSRLDPTIHVSRLVLISVPNKMQEILNSAIRTFKLPKKAANNFERIIEGKLNATVEEVAIDLVGNKILVDRAMIVHDQKDAVVKFEEAKSIHNSWENAILLATNGLGHYRLVKNPTLIQRVVAFINS